MLKSYLDGQPVLREPQDLRRRGLSFFVSVLAHAGLFLGVLLVYEPIKIHLYQDVRNVIIASPDEIFFPEYWEPSPAAAKAPGETSDSMRRPSAGTVPAVQEAAASETLSNASNKEALEPAYTSQFQLRPPPSDSLKLSSGYELELSLQEEPRVPFSSQMRQGKTEPGSDISDLAGTDLSGGKLPSYSGSRGPGGRSWLQVQLDQINQEADLSPWADAVVSIILGNWTVPPSGQYSLIGRVEIAVSIQKNGIVSRSMIQVSSQNSLIDQTALKAVETSSLPGLPEKYPGDMVQIKLVFALQ